MSDVKPSIELQKAFADGEGVDLKVGHVVLVGSSVLHELKIWPSSFAAVTDGTKTVELRRNDRGFKVGDVLRLREFVPCDKCKATGRIWDIGDKTDCCASPHGNYTGLALDVKVTHVTSGWGLTDGYVALSIQRMPDQVAQPSDGERATISSFRDENFFLSNFSVSEMKYAGMTWKTSEHAYQAMKTADQVEMLAIKMAPTAGKAKRMGAKCRMRDDWETVKVGIMKDIVRAKFSDPELAKMLLATGDAELIEGNNWNDTTWGCVWENGEWEGRNLLGRILMEIRAEFQEVGNVKA